MIALDELQTIGAGVEPTPMADAEPWRADAHCSTLGPEVASLFFSEDLPEISAAKSICKECPVLGACLEAALERREPCGVWGGQLFHNGRVVMNKRRRGRPPKTPRPEDQMVVVPIPLHLSERVAERRTA